MACVILRLYGELDEMARPVRRGREFVLPLRGPAAIKDLVESLGVPHTEVALILDGGQPVGLDHRVVGGERVAVYPRFTSLALPPELALQPPPLPAARRFVLDVHLGRLAAHLRLLGFDSWYRHDAADVELTARAAACDGILLTCDRGLLMRRQVRHGCWIRHRALREQLAQVVERYALRERASPFSRCPRCNTPLLRVTPAEAWPRAPQLRQGTPPS